MHKGILSQDSPSLAQNIKRYLKPDEAEKVTYAYAVAAKHGALNETGVVRAPEASYNPRPARVAQILITELRNYDGNMLCCAILGCARIESEISLPEELADIQTMLAELRESMSIKNLAPVSLAAEASLYAIILDEVRHLHMTDFSIELMKDKISQVQALIESKESFKENQRLVEKIRHALSKLETFVQEND